MDELRESTQPDSKTGRVTLVIKGRLCRSPYRGELYKAELAVIPMMRPAEYESVASFERRVDAPVFLSPMQRCKLIIMLLNEIRVSIINVDFFAVRMYGPENVQLPKELLASDVLVTHAPLTLVPCLLRSACQNFVIVHHSLRVDALDRGDNEVEVWFFELDQATANKITDYVHKSQFFQHFERLKIHRLGPCEVLGLPFEKGSVVFDKAVPFGMATSC